MKLVTLAIVAGVLWVCGCATLQNLERATTQPVAPQDLIAGLQKDLLESYNVAIDSGLLTTKQTDKVNSAYPIAQATLNAAVDGVQNQQPDALQLLDDAAKAVAQFKAKAK